MKIFNIILLIIILFIFCTTVWNALMCIAEEKLLKKIRRRVNVNGININVSVSGQGNKTIVLLGSMGIASPLIDLKPLQEKLSKKYKVALMEYAGYGLSDDTNIARTNDAIVEEIRITLKKLNLEPPYILMPHSASGVYCFYYMKKYKDEIEAIIGIESSVPNQVKYLKLPEINKSLYYIARLADFTGLMRLYNLFKRIDDTEDMKKSGSYSEEDLKTLKAVSSRRYISKAQLNEINSVKSNCESLYDMKLPDNVPVLFLLADKNIELGKKQGLPWQKMHKEVIQNPDIQKIEILKGSHYLHWTQSEAITEKTVDFIEKCNFSSQKD